MPTNKEYTAAQVDGISRAIAELLRVFSADIFQRVQPEIQVRMYDVAYNVRLKLGKNEAEESETAAVKRLFREVTEAVLAGGHEPKADIPYEKFVAEQEQTPTPDTRAPANPDNEVHVLHFIGRVIDIAFRIPGLSPSSVSGIKRYDRESFFKTISSLWERNTGSWIPKEIAPPADSQLETFAARMNALPPEARKGLVLSFDYPPPANGVTFMPMAVVRAPITKTQSPKKRKTTSKKK